MVAVGRGLLPAPHRSRGAPLTHLLPLVLGLKERDGTGRNVLIGGKKRGASRMNFSQLRRAVWLRRLSDMSHGCLALLKNHCSIRGRPTRRQSELQSSKGVSLTKETIEESGRIDP
jgi:hypothetical protein